MSSTATNPWWAEVEHLRPDEDGARPPARKSRTGRFDRRPAHREPDLWLESATAEPKPERRTIEIRGQVDRVAGVAPVPSPGPQRRRTVRPSERVGPRPDRVALWAVLLGLLLILVAAISSPGAEAAIALL